MSQQKEGWYFLLNCLNKSLNLYIHFNVWNRAGEFKFVHCQGLSISIREVWHWSSDHMLEKREHCDCMLAFIACYKAWLSHSDVLLKKPWDESLMAIWGYYGLWWRNGEKDQEGCLCLLPGLMTGVWSPEGETEHMYIVCHSKIHFKGKRRRGCITCIYIHVQWGQTLGENTENSFQFRNSWKYLNIVNMYTNILDMNFKNIK